MLMLGTVILVLLHKVGIKITQWYVMVLTLLKLYNNIIVDGLNRVTLIVQYINNQVVQTVLKLDQVLVHYLTIVVQLIKAEILLALHKVGLNGQQQVIIVHQIHQPVLKQVNIGI